MALKRMMVVAAGLVGLAASGAESALTPANLGDVKLTGFVGKKLDNFIRERVTSDWAKNVMMKECEDAFARKNDDATTVGMWEGEFWGKTMLGHARTAEYTRDPALLKFVVESCRRVMAFQEPDGYLGTYRKKDFLKITDWDAVVKDKGYRCDWNWNIWCRTFTIWGLAEAGRVTGERDFETAAARSLDQLIDMLHAKKIDITDTGCNAGLPSCTVIRPALLLYKATGNAKFLAFAKEIVAKWDRDPDTPPNFFRHVDSDLSPYRWYEKTFDHNANYEWPKVNEMTSCLEGLLAFAQATDDRRSFETAVKMAEILWRDERNPIDAVGYNDRFHCAATIPTGMTEPCDVIVWMMFCHDLYLATGEAKYADILEQTFLNAFLAGVYRDGTWAMRGVRSHGRHGPAGRGQSSLPNSHCCVNNVPRGFMDFAETTLAKDARGAYCLASYLDATAKMDDVEVTVSGNWPVGDVAHVKVVAPKATVFRFRIPGWSAGAKVNGKDVSAEKGWHTVELARGEHWFDFAFDMSAKIVGPVQPTDLKNVLHSEILWNRWTLSGASGDLMPYFLMRDLPRLRRGPLLLAKTTAVGSTEAEVFAWGRLDSHKNRPTQWTCTLTPDWNPNVWGAWYAKFTPLDKDIWWQEFEVKVSDYESAGDRAVDPPAKMFSIFY